MLKTYLISLIIASGSFATDNIPITDQPSDKGSSSFFKNVTPPKESQWLYLNQPIPSNLPHETFSNGHLSEVHSAQIKLFFPENWSPKKQMPVLCVCPGGGYAVEAIDKEGTHIAQWAAKLGMVGVVIKYRVSQKDRQIGNFPGPLLDTRKTIRLLRQNAPLLGINPNQIGIIGFSAGGHLAGMTATLFNHPLKQEKNDNLNLISSKPNFALLIYPVISSDPTIRHHGSINTLLGADQSNELLHLISVDQQVTKDTPPIFLAQSLDDFVSVENSHCMEKACLKHKVPVKKVLYPHGGHGYGMEKRGNPTDQWPEEAKLWLESQKIIPTQH